MSVLEQNIIALLSDLTGIERSELDNKASVETLEAWDSIAHINLILSIEDQYHITIDPELAADLTSVEMLTKFLAKQTY